MSADTKPEPVTTIDVGRRSIQSRFATSDPTRALDIITSYDPGQKVYVSWVRGVHYLEAGVGFTHGQDADAAGHQRYRSQQVGRYSRKTLENAAALALLAYSPQMSNLLSWAKNP